MLELRIYNFFTLRNLMTSLGILLQAKGYLNIQGYKALDVPTVPAKK